MKAFLINCTSQLSLKPDIVRILYARNETNLTHYLSSVYSVALLLRVSGLLVAHLQEVTVYGYISNNPHVLYLLADCRQADSQLTSTTRTNYRIYDYTLLPPDDGLQASPKHVEVERLNKLKINSASSWFHYAHISRCTVNKLMKKIYLVLTWVDNNEIRVVLIIGIYYEVTFGHKIQFYVCRRTHNEGTFF
jgi:hypothetical protein